METPKYTGADMALFDVVTKGNDGIKVELEAPNGSATDAWLVVLSADSDVFQKARAVARRKEIDITKRMQRELKDGETLDIGKLELAKDGINRDLCASLVSDWSFPAECTPKAVAEFFKKSPQIQAQVDSVAAQRQHFFSEPLTDSESTPGDSSS